MAVNQRQMCRRPRHEQIVDAREQQNLRDVPRDGANARAANLLARIAHDRRRALGRRHAWKKIVAVHVWLF